VSDLPAALPHRTRCGTPRRSRRGIWRATALVAVHLVVLVHVAHWKVAGRTLTPLEPSESMQTLELGYVNAGFLLFGALLLATVVLGRFFCGWACHVVAYQDLCAWLLGKLGLRPRPVRSRLLLLVPLGVAFYMFLWPQIEGVAASGPLRWHLTTRSFWKTFPGPATAALTFAVDGFLLVWLLGAKGFCTYGCPYGALFGIADRFAPGRIRVTDACEGCGHCTATCTSNVRVHEEVARFGAVVDPGCMKCMDCVNVCPKDALYFGFGAPSLVAKPARRRSFDFSWGEEIAMAAVFVVGLYAFRDLYHEVPFFLAIGLAVVGAIAIVALARLARRRDFALQRHALRREGRLTLAGALAAVVLAGFLGLVGHAALVQFQAKQGEGLLLAARDLRGDERARAREGAFEHLARAERLGLLGDGVLQLQLAQIERDRGNLPETERRLRRSIELAPRDTRARLVLAGLLESRGDASEARALCEAVLAIDPDNEVAARALIPK